MRVMDSGSLLKRCALMKKYVSADPNNQEAACKRTRILVANKLDLKGLNTVIAWREGLKSAIFYRLFTGTVVLEIP